MDGLLGSFQFGAMTGDTSRLPFGADVLASDGHTPRGEVVGS